MSSLNTDHLLDYFTDVEGLRETFTAYITAQELPKRIMVIHGIGGVGKSSLLRMFRLHCKSLKVPVALASGDESKLVPSILSDWGDDLIADHVSLPHFVQTLRRYHEVQAQVANKARESREKLGELVGKTAGRVAETATTVGFGAALGALIPGAGAVGGALTGMGVEALVGWLRGFLSKSDIDLILDPAKRLTEEFLDDLGRMKPKRRIVLMLDTFEQLSALDSWVCDLAQRLPSDVLFVIAGRAMPKWSRMWPSWLGVAHVEELTPMTDDVMRELVRRYYATVRGGEPDARQVEAIVRFGRGLPMVAAAAVELWVEHGVEQFETIKAEVVADLVDRLKEGVKPEMLPILEAAATLRWFNQEILREVTGTAEISQAYHELRRFPFVRSHTEGLALHDAMREIIDDHLRGDDPARYRTLHERAAIYFEAQTAVRVGAKAERNQLERLYHRVCADEEKGIALFQALAEELVHYRAFVRLRALLSDVNTYALEFDNSRLWREYYNARLPHKEAHMGAAGRIYQAIGENAHAEVKLRSYSFCDWGGVLTLDKYLGEPGGAERAARVLQRSLGLGFLDTHLIQAFLWLGRIARYQGEWDQQQAYLDWTFDNSLHISQTEG